jgi:hypothetical protein
MRGCTNKRRLKITKKNRVPVNKNGCRGLSKKYTCHNKERVEAFAKCGSMAIVFK